MVTSPNSNYWYSYGNVYANCLLSNEHNLMVKFLVMLFNSRVQFGPLVE